MNEKREKNVFKSNNTLFFVVQLKPANERLIISISFVE